MKRNGSENLYWQNNKLWYKVTPKEKFKLISKAPKKAKKSFFIYKYGPFITPKKLKMIIESYFIEFILFNKLFQKNKKNNKKLKLKNISIICRWTFFE